MYGIIGGMNDDGSNIVEGESPDKSNGVVKSKKKFFLIVGLTLAVIAAAFIGYAGYVYATTPAVVRNPKLEHYHFRMQILVNGKAEDFSSKLYQTGYAKDQCNASLPEQPIHFHDNKDQFTHIHWEAMTGGMVMKYYGWNFIGGMNNSLGYKLTGPRGIQKVNIHGNYLPKIPRDARFYVYSGDQNAYTARKFDDWKNQDLEKFFGRESTFPAHDINYGAPSSLRGKLFPKAAAHGAVNDEPAPGGVETQTEKLTRLNNLEGNVVIFVQKNPPTDQQIKDRFNALLPLSDSTCGG